MLNDGPVRREAIPDKSFRPARVRLRPRTQDPRNAAPARVRAPERSGRWSWLRPAAFFGLLAVLGLGTALSTDRVTGVIAAAQGEIAQGTEGARRAWRAHLQTAAVEAALHDVEQQNARLRLEVLHLRSLDAERRRLARLLQVTGAQGLEGVGARVIARGGGGRQTLRLDAGVDKGVVPGLPVVGTRGVVGQVVASGQGWSDVLCVTDPSHGLAGVLSDGPSGVLRGTRTGLALDHVLSRFEVEPGTPVLTRGGGDVFPGGLPVGVVASAAPDPGTPFLAIEVTPAAPPELLSEVLVVTGRTERPEVAWR